MLIYVIRRAIWEYRMFSYGFRLRKLSNRIVDLEVKRERNMRKYEKFKKKTKKYHQTLGRYIHN